jgi:putative ABC transport system substrate-binding protein
MAGADPVDPYAKAFIGGLRDLGLVEGRDVLIERRSSEGRDERLGPLMREMVDLGADVIVTWGHAAVVAKQTTDRVAIVALVSDPLEGHLVESLAHPGRNITGIGSHGDELENEAKILQLLAEAAAGIRLVAVLSSSPPPAPRRCSFEPDLQPSRAPRSALM